MALMTLGCVGLGGSDDSGDSLGIGGDDSGAAWDGTPSFESAWVSCTPTEFEYGLRMRGDSRELTKHGVILLETGISEPRWDEEHSFALRNDSQAESRFELVRTLTKIDSVQAQREDETTLFRCEDSTFDIVTVGMAVWFGDADAYCLAFGEDPSTFVLTGSGADVTCEDFSDRVEMDIGN
jgi:hypothetical protein